MINSMTAFARKTVTEDWGTITVELRSVNHRYLDVAVRIAEDYRNLEMEVRELIRHFLVRGKIDCYVVLHKNNTEMNEITINKSLLQRLTKVLHETQQLVGDAAAIDLMRLLMWPGVIDTKLIAIEKIQAAVLGTIKNALVELVDMRAREGETLQKFIQSRLNKIEQLISNIEKQYQKAIEQQRNKLLIKLAEVKNNLDPVRLEQEIIFFSQKIDIAEELERLKAHIRETHNSLMQQQGIGRRLDFLMQEFHREANTIGSKTTDIEISHWVVDLKVLIEQMREQIQNIE